MTGPQPGDDHPEEGSNLAAEAVDTEGDELVDGDLEPEQSRTIDVEATEIRPRVDLESDGVDANTESPNYLADLQRVSAEFANYRKQTERRNAEMARQAGSRLALQLLTVLDAIDAAVQHGVDGIEPIRDQLFTVLEREGLEQITDQDEIFDPSRHEATMTEPADDGQDSAVVSEVFRTGYAWNGRVLRAAMVKVKG